MINGNIQSWKQNQVASRYNESNKPIILVNEWNWDWKWCQWILYRSVWLLTFHMFASMQNNLKPSEIMFQFCRQAPLGLPVDQEEAVFHEWLKVPSLSGKNSIFIMSFVYHSPYALPFLLDFFLISSSPFSPLKFSHVSSNHLICKRPIPGPLRLIPIFFVDGLLSYPPPLSPLQYHFVLWLLCISNSWIGENIMVTPLFPHFWLILFVTQIS